MKYKTTLFTRVVCVCVWGGGGGGGGGGSGLCLRVFTSMHTYVLFCAGPYCVLCVLCVEKKKKFDDLYIVIGSVFHFVLLLIIN